MSKTQFRILMLLTVISGLVGGALVSWLVPGRTAFAQGGSQKVVTAEEFRLVNRWGSMKASLSMQDEGPALLLYDAAGEPRLSLDVPNGDPGLALYDGAGEGRVLLRLIGQDPTFGLCYPGSEPRVFMVVDEQGPQLNLYGAANTGHLVVDSTGVCIKDVKDNPRAALGLQGDFPTLYLWDAAGKSGVMLSARENNPHVRLYDAADTPRAVLNLINGAPCLAFADAGGNIGATLNMVKGGMPALHLLNAKGKVVFSAP